MFYAIGSQSPRDPDMMSEISNGITSLTRRIIEAVASVFGGEIRWQFSTEQTTRCLGLEDNPTYQAYLQDYATLCKYVDDINAKYPAGTAPQHVIDDITTIQQAIPKLGTIYQSNANDCDAFKKAAESLMGSCESAYNDAMDVVPRTNKEKIAQDLREAQALYESMKSAVSNGKANCKTLTSDMDDDKEALATLQKEVDSLKPGSKKDAANEALYKADTDLDLLSKAQKTAQSQEPIVDETLKAVEKSIAKLEKLAKLDNPGGMKVQNADKTLATIRAQNSAIDSFTKAVGTATAHQTDVIYDIQAVKDALHPPVPGKIVNGCWLIDWTTHSYDGLELPTHYLGKKLDAINFFVGEFIEQSDGTYTIGGYGDYTQDDITKLAIQAHQKGMKFCLSIGGGGGSYDNTWDILTDDNIDAVAQSLVEYCKATNADGIDFDCEDYNPETLSKVGKLIKAFKEKNSKLRSSVCANAGFGPQYQWQANLKLLLDETIVNGKSVIDSVNIMSYYNDKDSETKWLDGWREWCIATYGLKAENVCVGVDDYDAHAYKPEDMVAYAESKGMPWCHWAYDPGHPATSMSRREALKTIQKMRFLASCKLDRACRETFTRHGIGITKL